MNTEKLLYMSLGAAAIGALLVFALDNGSSIGPFNAQPLGGIVLGLALALMIGAAISVVKTTAAESGGAKPEAGDGRLVSEESLRAITGLVAVVAGIVAVGALTVVTVELVGVGKDGNTEATVAITTAAFGIVSTTITAYLGIKATANAGKTSRVEKDPPKETREKTGGE